MKKILIVHPDNDFTGSTVVLYEVIKEFIQSGYSASIITSDSHGILDEFENYIRFYRVRQFKYKGKRVKYISFILSRMQFFLLSFIIGFFHDTIYINTILPYYASIASFFNRTKVKYHVHEKFIVYTKELRFAEYVFNHTKAERIFVSKYLKNQYPDNGNSIVKYNKLSQRFINNVNYKNIQDRKLDTCLMVCSLNLSKGIFTYIELARQLPNLNFVLVISSTMDEISQYLATDYPSNLSIYPRQSNLHDFYRKADLLFSLTIPTLSIETFGMTILEAMAYGIPSIVPNVGGPTELIINGYNGYCIDVTDIGTLSHYVELSLESRNYFRLANNSLERFKEFNK